MKYRLVTGAEQLEKGDLRASAFCRSPRVLTVHTGTRRDCSQRSTYSPHPSSPRLSLPPDPTCPHHTLGWQSQSDAAVTPTTYTQAAEGPNSIRAASREVSRKGFFPWLAHAKTQRTASPLSAHCWQCRTLGTVCHMPLILPDSGAVSKLICKRSLI